VTGLLVIGASYAGIQAALTAREAGYSEAITAISDEEWLPYQRPPLSKDFLLDGADERSLILRDEALFENKRINLVLGHRVTEIDPRAGRVTLSGGGTLKFEKLLLGTGSRARRIAVPGSELDGVCYLRSIADAVDLKARLAESAELVIVGGGFVGLEAAASAAKLGKKVTVVETAPRLLERAVSSIVSNFLFDVHLRAGVDVMLGETVISIDGRNGRVSGAVLSSGAKLGADVILVGIGGIANEELADAAGLKCANGILVDEHGKTENPGIWAAGDCANHFSKFADGWIRLESVQNAQDQARTAGLSIAGSYSPYDSVPRFWSDQYDIKLQMVGLAGRYDRLAVRGSVEAGNFSVFYYRDGKLVAVDSVNRPGDQLAARRLIGVSKSPSPQQVEDLGFDLKSLVRGLDKASA
jgi:3-phenylpropionate/trans-cinnamate dioxygenase ferredoxin reductase component